MNTDPQEEIEKTRRRRGILNKAQAQELALAEQLAQVAQRPAYAPMLADGGIDAEFFSTLRAEVELADALIDSAGALATARLRTTLFEREARTRLLKKLRAVQARAKSKYAASDKAALRDYFIGQKIDNSRALLESSAKTILARAKRDALPGLTPEKLALLEQALADFRAIETQQSGKQLQSTQDRRNLERVIKAIADNRRRIQFAADAEWPPGRANAPIRRDFKLPVGRAL